VIIQRERYLSALINRMHNGLVKVVTGIRRSGKSFLIFKIFKQYLLDSGIDDSHIITLALDDRRNKRYRNPDEILKYIDLLIADRKNYYIFLDEIQLLIDFEEVLNSLMHIPNADIYVTGSNSRFLSKDIITEFRGRGDEIHIFPLSFQEFMQNYKGDIYHGWTDYATYGGLPLVSTMKTEAQKMQYLTNLFAETYLKDIIERNRIEKTQELDDLLNILASAIGSYTNPARIEATFKSVSHSSFSANTIRQYIGYLEDAFIISAAQRYNVKGRKYIGTPLKYYFEDVGLRNAKLGFRQVKETHLMENIIYNELRSRGYSVDVGVVEQRRRTPSGKSERVSLEIDFVANLGSKRYYIQSALRLSNEAKKEQEQRSLLMVQDAFKKIIITKDALAPLYNEEGVLVMSIFDFLLNEGSLEV
jgi:predicted AAA+ superfamily ATPase